MKATYPQLAYVACRVLSMHATTAASERDWSLWGAIYYKSRNRLSVDHAGKLVYIKSNRVQQAPAPAFEVMLSLLSDGAFIPKSLTGWLSDVYMRTYACIVACVVC